MDGVGDGVEQMGFAQAGFPVDEEGVVISAGCSATARAAAWANLLELPTTNRSKVYSSVPGRKRETGSRLPYFSFSSSLRTTTSSSAEKRS